MFDFGDRVVRYEEQIHNVRKYVLSVNVIRNREEAKMERRYFGVPFSGLYLTALNSATEHSKRQGRAHS